MSIEGPDDVAGLKRICAIVAEARDTMMRSAIAGMSTAELDAIGRDVLSRHGARSAPKLAYEFPGHTCISVNDALAHGIPSSTLLLKAGDLVNVDVSAELDGYWGDTGASFAIGTITPRQQALLDATKAALADGISSTRAGRPVYEIGRAVERRAKQSGFRVIKNICGHGVGRFIHEPPNVPNTFDRSERQPLHEGLVITIEPFLTFSATKVVTDDDGWTLRTPDGSLGAQFEHTMIVTRGAPIILTA